MKELTHISLFAGIGGIDLAAEWAGFRTVLFVEIDKYCQKVLAKHWPDVPIIGDIRDVTKEKIMVYTESRRINRVNGNDKEATTTNRFRDDQSNGRSDGYYGGGTADLSPVTLVTGGFPCQPVSTAGKRRGKEDDRWLWPEMLRVISVVRPTWVVAENVDGITGMVQFDSDLEVDGKEYTEEQMAKGYLEVGQVCERVGKGILDEVMGNLEACGYDVRPFVIPACGVNAPHRRNRIFIVAHAKSTGTRSQCRKVGDKGWGISKDRGESIRQGNGKIGSSGLASTGEDVAHTINHRSRTSECTNDRNRQKDNKGREGWSKSGIGGQDEAVADTIIGTEGTTYRKGSHPRGADSQQNDRNSLGDDTGNRSEALADTEKQSQRESTNQENTISGSREPWQKPSGRDWGAVESGLGMLADGISPGVGRYNPHHYDQEPDIPRVATGIKNRVEQLKAYGNAVDPMQIYPILKGIADIENKE